MCNLKIKENMKLKNILAALLAASIFAASCSSDFLDTKSTSAVDQTEMFTNTTNAMMALQGLHKLMYKQRSTAPQMGYGVFMLWMDFMAEDLVYTRSNAQWGGATKLTLHHNPTSSYLNHIYGFFYDMIVNANMLLENIDNAEGPQEERDYIKGQALVYRAYMHFCAVQLWGKRYAAGEENTQDGIILKLSTSLIPEARSSVETVYEAINKDLDEAIALLDGIDIQRAAKYHIDVHVARGIKARVLLTQGRWSDAAAMAEKVISESGAKLQANTYDRVVGRGCNASNTEWIWAKIGQPTVETGTLCQFFSYVSNSNVSYNKNTPRAIYNLLYDKISDTDVRKSLWLPDAPSMSTKDIVYPPSGRIYKWMSQKYIVDGLDNTSSSYAGNVYTADLPFMRLPEMMLIAAECYARMGQDDKAATALYPLASIRDPQYTKSTNTGEALIEEIMIQRRVELWCEGFRFLDLKRLNLPLDRGPAPRAGYNQGGAANGWGTKKTPTNLDPLASNFNMYEDQPIGEDARYREAGTNHWQFVFPKNEVDRNPLLVQNPY